MSIKKEESKQQLKTIDIKGKSYVMVNERIRAFHDEHDDGSIITEILSDDGGRVIIKASIYIGGELRAVGHAYEKEQSSFINKTSYIENCETSAVGRALGIFGIGIEDSVASAEELANAIKQQNDNPKNPDQYPSEDIKPVNRYIDAEQVKILQDEITALEVDFDKFCSTYGVLRLEDIKTSQFENAVKRLSATRTDRAKKKAEEDTKKPIESVSVADVFDDSLSSNSDLDGYAEIPGDDPLKDGNK